MAEDPNVMSVVVVTALKALFSALAVGLVSTPIVLNWQHRYWRMQKIVELQRDTYTNAKDTLLSYFYERPHEPGTPEFKQQRMDVASLATEVARLFSNKAYCYSFDAVASLGALRREVTLQAGESSLTDKERLKLSMETLFRIRTALDQMAREVGRQPGRRWWHIKQEKPKLGRREYDHGQGLGIKSLLTNLSNGNPGRRESDKLWDMVFGSDDAS